VDIGIFIVVLQFFAAMATVEGEDRVLFQGLVLCFWFWFFLMGALGVYSWLLGCWMIEIFRRMTVRMAQLNCCRVVGAEQQEMRWLISTERSCMQSIVLCVGGLFVLN
jgi:hypothetical protein